MPFLLCRMTFALGLVSCWLSMSGSLQAQGNEAPPFPEAAAQWVNSAPLSLEQLKGKGIFLWLYEEEHPVVRQKWPALMALSQKYADEPVVFIAVNSGTTRAAVQTYVQQNRITWPVLVDTSRAYEIATGVGQIRMQDYHQVMLISVDRTIRRGRWEDLEGGAKQVLEGAQWKVSPKGLPPVMRPAWNAVEFGNYASAGSTITKSLNSTKPELKSAAEKLMAVVQPLIDAQLAEIKAAEEAGDKWKTYRACSVLVDTFKGFDLPEDAVKNQKALANDTVVKDELAALKMYELAMKSEEAGATAVSKRTQTMLKKLVKEKPDTEAGKKAQAILGMP